MTSGFTSGGRAALALAACLFLPLSGCFLVNFPPSVSLAASATEVAAGAEVTVTADCWDLNGDALQYLWMVESVRQTEETSSTFLFAAYPAETRTYDVTVRVTDGPNAVTASIAITVHGQTVVEAGYSGTAPWVSGAYEGGLTYTLDTGSAPRDVYFVFTNAGMTAADTNPAVGAMSSLGSRSASAFPGSAAHGAIRGRPEISEFNRTAGRYFSGRKAQAKGIKESAEPIIPGVSEETFHDADYESYYSYYDLQATCRAVVGPVTAASTGKPRTLYVWVANDCWEAASAEALEPKAHYVTQAMVDALARKFLTDSSNDAGQDVYNWVTAIYGEEWPSTGEGVVLDASLIAATDEIHILLCDIDRDNAADSGTIGYFWSKDNLASYSQGGVNVSNQRIMFYIDAVMFANPEDSAGQEAGAWSTDGYWFGETVSTLAHEFHHMIEFYGKSVLQQVGGEDTWLNEMCSQVTEDLVADKLGVIGPRGVAYGDGTAGSAGNEEGRLPIHNPFSYMGLVEWIDDPGYVLVSYSNTYAFGAYLARNYGGPGLFRALLRNGYTDAQAVTQAVKDVTGQNLSFSELVRRWGAASLLSDTVNPPAYHVLNAGGWKTWGLGGTSYSYSLGSINLYNYKYVDPNDEEQLGPLIFDEAEGIPTVTQNLVIGGACSVFYLAGDGITGSHSWPVEMPDGYVMTVVVK